MRKNMSNIIKILLNLLIIGICVYYLIAQAAVDGDMDTAGGIVAFVLIFGLTIVNALPIGMKKDKNAPKEKLTVKKVVKRIGSIVLLIAAFLSMLLLDFSTLGIVIGTILGILGITAILTSSDAISNSELSSIQRITTDVSLDEIYDKFKEMDTSLGKMWMGELKTIKKAILIGPNVNDEYVVLWRNSDTLFIQYNNVPSLIKDQDKVKQIQSNNKVIYSALTNEEYASKLLTNVDIVNELRKVISEYLNEGCVRYIDYDPSNIGKTLVFDEEFSLLKQKFNVYDLDKNPMYAVEAPLPLLNFKITNINTNSEVITIKKDIVALTQQYEFFWNGEKYGTLKKQVDAIDRFIMETNDGTFEMKEISGNLLDSYIVRLNDKSIGIITDKAVLSLHNIVFDNYILHVKDNKYLELMIAFAVMAAREKARDDSASRSSSSND